MRFSPFSGDNGCVECLMRMQTIRERAEFLQAHGCEITVAYGKAPRATWFVYLHTGAQAGNATPMCRHCAQAYLSNALEKGEKVQTPNGLGVLPEDSAPFSERVPVQDALFPEFAAADVIRRDD